MKYFIGYLTGTINLAVYHALADSGQAIAGFITIIVIGVIGSTIAQSVE